MPHDGYAVGNGSWFGEKKIFMKKKKQQAKNSKTNICLIHCHSLYNAGVFPWFLYTMQFITISQAISCQVLKRVENKREKLMLSHKIAIESSLCFMFQCDNNLFTFHMCLTRKSIGDFFHIVDS